MGRMAAPSDPQAKIDRADKHIRALARMIRRFRQEAYAVGGQPAFGVDPDPAHRFDVIVLAEARKEPPSLLWGPIIGDIVHGLRSALDQVAWGLSIDHQATIGKSPRSYPIPSKSPWRDISFPICRDGKYWDDVSNRKLWAVDSGVGASLKGFQPFNTGPQAPNREPLAVLEELWNIDKHRHLHLINATVELRKAVSVELFPGMPRIDFEVISQGPLGGPFVGPAEVGRARPIERPGVQTPRTNAPHMFMYPDLAVDVAFDQGAPAYGGSVLKTLRHLRKTVQDIVSAV
jgi:hypothetical protein